MLAGTGQDVIPLGTIRAGEAGFPPLVGVLVHCAVYRETSVVTYVSDLLITFESRSNLTTCAVESQTWLRASPLLIRPEMLRVKTG